MKRLGWMVCVVALAACAKTETAVDTTAAVPATPPPPAPIQLADVAGNWTVKGMNAAGDSTLVTYDLVATADTTGWQITFANGQKVPMRIVAVAGDSITIKAGPYASVLRRNVRVSTDGVFRLQHGMLMGTTVAHYNVKTADSVVTLKTEGTRKP